MKLKLKNLLLGFVLVVTTSAYAGPADKFSSAEQTQVLVKTPNLFANATSFDVDLSQLSSDYTFPLPVGKAVKQSNNSVRISSVKGDAIKAMFDGVVRLSRKSGSFGNVVVLRHSNGLETVYANNAQNLVKVGQNVKAGQTIALIGARNGHYYCDFSIMVNGGRINPSLVFEIKSHRLNSRVLTCRKHGSYVDVFVQRNPRKKIETAEKTAELASANVEKNAETARKYSESPKVEPVKRTTIVRTASSAKNVDVAKRPETSKGKMNNVDRTPMQSLGIVSLDPEDAIELNSNTFQINLSNLEKEHWAYPLPGSHVISPYGGKRNHAGVDVKTRPNDKIVAAFDGVVTRSCPYYGYGNCIVIKHAYGFETLYSHQSKNFVKVGQHVKAGEVIGLTGRTGRATTEHLHFEVHYKGRRINPAILFNHSSQGLQQVTLTLTKGGKINSQKNYYADNKK